MPAYKDKEKGTWYASFYYEDWTGKKVKKLKRGFSTKRDALEWEQTFLQQQTADLEMTFENFVALYAADMKGRIKENTWGTKEHSAVLDELRRIEAGSSLNDELLDVIEMIAAIMDGMKEENAYGE